MASVGINWILGSSLDLLTDRIEPLSASKTFGDDPDAASNHAVAFISGLERAGVIACPNSRPDAPVLEIYRSQNYKELDVDTLRAIEKKELVSSSKVVEQCPRSCLQICTQYYDFSDFTRATRSIQATIELLFRQHFVFQGPIVSSFAEVPQDSNICVKHMPLRAFLLGADLVNLPNDERDQQTSITALTKAFGSSRFPLSLLASSAERVKNLKAVSLAWTNLTDPKRLHTLLSAHSPLAHAAYRSSIAALSHTPSTLTDLPSSSILVILTPTVPRLDVNNAGDPFEPLGHAIANAHSRTRHVPYTLSAGLTPTHTAFLQRASAVVLVLCNTSSAFVESQDEFVRAVQSLMQAQDAQPGRETKTRKVVIGAGDPRDLRGSWMGWWGVCCFEYSRASLEAVAEVVLGRRTATGLVPLSGW